MKKLGVVLGGAIGFVLGSRSGRKPYESLEGKARQLARRPRVRAATTATKEKVGQAVTATSDGVHAAKDAVEEKLGTVSHPEDGAH